MINQERIIRIENKKNEEIERDKSSEEGKLLQYAAALSGNYFFNKNKLNFPLFYIYLLVYQGC